MSNPNQHNQSTPTIPIFNIASYTKKIHAILHSEYARFFLNLVQYNQAHRKKVKMLREIAPKKCKVGWRVIYVYLLRKTEKNYQIPKMIYKYLDYKANNELKFLYEESKRFNVTYNTYIDIYLSKMLKQRNKIEEKHVQKDLQTPQSPYGIRKIKNTKTIRILTEDNSEDESQKEKKQKIIDHINHIKNESREQSKKIINAERHQKKTTYRNIKSKLLLNRYDHQPLTTRTEINNEQSLGYSGWVMNTTSSNNYNTCLTEPHVKNKTIKHIKPFPMNLKKKPEDSKISYLITSSNATHNNTKKIKQSMLFPIIGKGTPKVVNDKNNVQKKYGSIQIFKKGDFYYI